MRPFSISKFFVASLAALALSTPLQAVEEKGRIPLDELRTFADVYNQIRSGYVEEIDDSTLLEYAIQGMLMGLDPHSVYLTREDFENLQETTTGEFSGLGIEVGMEDGYVTIISPIDGSPAAEAGLQSGDVILKLDDTPIKGMSLNEAIDLMRGPKGSRITLTIGRPGESQPFEVNLVRDTIKVASVRQRWLEPGFGYIRIAQFQSHTGEDVTRALEKLMAEQDLKGLVLDLRNNPGGILRASVDVAGLFLDGGTVVYTEGRLRGHTAGGADQQRFRQRLRDRRRRAAGSPAGGSDGHQQFRQGLGADGAPPVRFAGGETDHGPVFHTQRPLYPGRGHRARYPGRARPGDRLRQPAADNRGRSQRPPGERQRREQKARLVQQAEQRVAGQRQSTLRSPHPAQRAQRSGDAQSTVKGAIQRGADRGILNASPT
jgi:hypothetical protein